MNIYEIIVTTSGINGKPERSVEEVIASSFQEVCELMGRVERDAMHVTLDISIREIPNARPFDGRLRRAVEMAMAS